MFSKYIKLTAMLLALCMLTACAGPVDGPAAAAPAEIIAEESGTAENPEAAPAPTEEPWPEGYYIESALMAEQTARAELEKMKALHIFADKFFVTEAAPDYVKFFAEAPIVEEGERPFIAVRWYGNSAYFNNWEGDNPYSIVVNMDPDTGKIFNMSIEAAADKDAPVVFELPMMDYNEETGEEVESGEVWLYHQNFHDLYPQDMSLAGFCDLLNEYWGFDGWSLGGGGALNVNAPLEEISAGTSGSRYVVIDFEGNEYSEYMYVQLVEFPGRVCLNVGTEHSNG